MQVDFRRWAVFAHKDDTGFGRMAANLRSVLGFGGHLVSPSLRLTDRALDPGSEWMLPPDAPVAELERALAPWQGVVFFERTSWHPQLLATARRIGVKTACIPMWEWFQGAASEWHECDLFICPTKFTEKLVRRYGWRHVVPVPWAFDLARFPARNISGPARRFIHNAGLVDADDRKGTRDTIRAFMRVRDPGLRLLVRAQKAFEPPPIDERVEIRIGNIDDPAALYAEGDCAIQPSKMEGIGFMVLEPVASGLPVITVDYPPMNEFVAQPEMRLPLRWFRRRAFASQWVRHAHLRLPRRRALERAITWCATHDLAPIARQNRLWAEEVFAPSRLRQVWTNTVQSFFSS